MQWGRIWLHTATMSTACSATLSTFSERTRGREHIAFALVFHDVGMWTDQELAYLEPSEAVAEEVRAKHAPHLDAGLVSNIIHWHHKLLPFSGPDAAVVNAARKADWIDASMGVVRHGVPRRDVKARESAIPVLGFPNVLMRLAKDLRNGNQMAGVWRVLSHVYKLLSSGAFSRRLRRATTSGLSASDRLRRRHRARSQHEESECRRAASAHLAVIRVDPVSR